VVESFGVRLRRLREQRHMTPSALAHAVGVTEGAIRQMESGQTKSASFLVGLKLAEVLGVTPAYLVTGREKLSETGSPSPAPQPASVLERHTMQIAALERRVKSLEARLRGGTRRKAPE
jgi:transcriptional regulator with XRE-family HTH domain